MAYKVALIIAAAAAAVAALTTFGRDAAVMTAAVAPIVQLLTPASRAASAIKNSTAVPSRERWVQQISWEPRSYLFHGFLSDEEVALIKTAAAPYMKRSMVVGDAKQHLNVVNDIRTSYGMFIRRNDPVIKDILQKVSEWAKLPLR
jgi:prolyl 4-hydroxylase